MRIKNQANKEHTLFLNNSVHILNSGTAMNHTRRRSKIYVASDRIASQFAQAFIYRVTKPSGDLFSNPFVLLCFLFFETKIKSSSLFIKC